MCVLCCVCMCMYLCVNGAVNLVVVFYIHNKYLCSYHTYVCMYISYIQCRMEVGSQGADRRKGCFLTMCIPLSMYIFLSILKPAMYKKLEKYLLCML